MIWNTCTTFIGRHDAPRRKSTSWSVLLATAFAVATGGAAIAQTAGSYQVNPILSDGYATAPVVDASFIDPWGFNNVGTFWINANVSGLSYVNGTNGTVKLKAIVAAANGTSTGKPTGIVKNTTTGFVLSNRSAASFLFGTLDGTISGWNSVLGGTLPSLIAVNNSAKNAVYTDIALDSSASGSVLLAANFGAGGNIEVYNQSFALVTLPGSFTDPNIPAGYAPYSIHVINNQVYVTYTLRSTTPTGVGGYGSSGSPSYSETLGPNTGFVSVFDVNGNFLSRAITGGNLNAPWGMALAPTTFGPFGGDLLVGNLGDGLINVYNPTTYAYLGQLTDQTGKPVLYSLPGAGITNSYLGLWELGFGNGSATGTPAITNAGDPTQLYFAAGLDAEQHGLFGSISNVAPTGGNTSFGFSASSPVLAVKAGTTGTTTLALIPINGFTGSVTLTCAGLPADSTCSFAPSSVSLSATAPASTTLTINTSVATSKLTLAPFERSNMIELAALPCGLLLYGLCRRRRNLIVIRLAILLVTAATATAFVTGCSSGMSAARVPVTPAGTATITVTATSGSVSQTTKIALTVQ